MFLIIKDYGYYNLLKLKYYILKDINKKSITIIYYNN